MMLKMIQIINDRSLTLLSCVDNCLCCLNTRVCNYIEHMSFLGKNKLALELVIVH